jgi:hypothetical protein
MDDFLPRNLMRWLNKTPATTSNIPSILSKVRFSPQSKKLKKAVKTGIVLV